MEAVGVAASLERDVMVSRIGNMKIAKSGQIYFVIKEQNKGLDKMETKKRAVIIHIVLARAMRWMLMCFTEMYKITKTEI